MNDHIMGATSCLDPSSSSEAWVYVCDSFSWMWFWGRWMCVWEIVDPDLKIKIWGW